MLADYQPLHCRPVAIGLHALYAGGAVPRVAPRPKPAPENRWAYFRAVEKQSSNQVYWSVRVPLGP